MKKCQIRSRLPIVLSAIVQVAAAHAATVVHLSFDDTVEPIDASGGAVTVRSGTPAYTNDVPGPQVCWLTNETASARRSNSRSLRLDGASVALNLTHQKLFKPNLPNATIEFFIKGESATAWGSSLLLFTSGSAPFPFLVQPNGSTQYFLRADTWPGSSTSGWTQQATRSANASCRCDDKKWHHVALTVTAVEGGTSEVRFYFDYVQLGSAQTTDHSWSGLAEGMFLRLGVAGSVSSIDELRISDTPLTAGQFLRLEPEAHDGDTLIHLSFDDGSLSSLARPTETPVLTSGVLAFTNDVPHATIWTEEGSVSRANTGALHATNTITLTVPQVALLSPQPLTKPNLPNATIEFFVKGISAKNLSGWPSPFCIGDTQSRFFVQVNNQGKYYYRVDTSTTQNKSYAGATFADKHWHHVALTIAESVGGASDITLYFDHRAVYSATTDSAWNGLNAMTIKFGNPNTDLLVDEFRVTKGVLPVSEFLPGAPKTEEGETLVHLPFDGTLASLGRADAAPVLHSGTPVFSQSRYSAVIDDRKGGRDSCRENKGSLFAEDRFFMTFPSNAMLRPYLDSVTIEFFLKGVSGNNWDSAMGFVPNPASPSTPPFPVLFQINSSGNLQVRFDGFADVYSGVRETKEAVIGSPFADNKWHHYAITIEPTLDGQTHYMAYRDYAPVSENGWTSSTYPFLGLTEGMALRIGGASFYLDELRMTKGVLSPERFLQCGATGMIILFR